MEPVLSRTRGNGAGGGSKPRVLLVEDEIAVSDLVCRALDRSGFDVSPCQALAEARAVLQGGLFDVAVIDLVLPDGDGLDLVAEVSSTMPTIALTGLRGAEHDRILGFEAGADDYVLKPFSMRELTARVRAVLRRQVRAGAESEQLRYDDLEIDLVSREVRVDGVVIPFTRKEFDLLVALASRPRRACSRDELLDWVWRSPPGTIGPATVT